jgi:hypothetical protein
VPRTLTVSRVSVRDGGEAEYLSAIRALQGLAEARGWHLWVFRHPRERGRFLECSESRSAATHRAGGSRPADEQALEARLRAVANYEPGAWELWEEVG